MIEVRRSGRRRRATQLLLREHPANQALADAEAPDAEALEAEVEEEGDQDPDFVPPPAAEEEVVVLDAAEEEAAEEDAQIAAAEPEVQANQIVVEPYIRRDGRQVQGYVRIIPDIRDRNWNLPLRDQVPNEIVGRNRQNNTRAHERRGAFTDYCRRLHVQGNFPRRTTIAVIQTVLYMFASAKVLGRTLDPAPRLDPTHTLPTDSLGMRVLDPQGEQSVIIRVSQEEFISVVSEDEEVREHASIWHVMNIVLSAARTCRRRLHLNFDRDLVRTGPHDVPFGNRVSAMSHVEINTQLRNVHGFHLAVERFNLRRRTLEERIRDPNGSANAPRPPAEE